MGKAKKAAAPEQLQIFHVQRVENGFILEICKESSAGQFIELDPEGVVRRLATELEVDLFNL